MEFNVYCAKVFAGIGTLPDTLSRRSIPISLKRRAKHEKVQDFILVDVEPDAEALQKRLVAWAENSGEAVATTRPSEIPEEMSDRMQESCFSLIAIADSDELRSGVAQGTCRDSDQRSCRLNREHAAPVTARFAFSV